ncbi:MAG TPA: hypothetical protein VFE51_01510 [Verrucomicrobiae bacterium]|nr:hypothetical protein [Verrucomicrobiae bacterium]
MKLIINFLTMSIAVSLGLGLGIYWKQGRAKSIAGQQQGNRATTQQPKKQAGRSRSQVDDSPLATQLQHDLSMSSGVTRWLHWIEALERAHPEDYFRLASLARGDAIALRFVATRWIQSAPRHLFDTLVEASKSGGTFPVRELGRALFDQWPKSDPESAIAALNEPGDLGMRHTWQTQVAAAIAETNPERGIQIMSQWHIENYGAPINGIEAWARANPRHAAEFTLANPAGYVSQLSVDTIGSEWAKTDPSGALGFATSQSGELASRLASKVLKDWAGRNLGEAADWLAATDQRTRNQLSPAFLETWAKQDTAGALTWAQQNLDGDRMNQTVTSIVKTAAEKDLAGAVAMVNAMDPSATRSAAAVAVAQQWFPGDRSTDQPKPEAIQWLSSLDQDSVRRVLDKVSWNWANSDPSGMARFLASASSAEVPPYTDSILAQQMARTSPREALDWAASLPPSRGNGAGADAFAAWRRSQPDAAVDWLNSLPPDDSRRQPFFEQAIKSMAYDPQAPQELASLPPGQQVTARNVIATMSLPEAQRNRLLDALNGP